MEKEMRSKTELVDFEKQKSTLKLCGGRDLNPRTPTRLDPESSAFSCLGNLRL